MRTLPYDYCRCKPIECPDKNDCARYTSPVNLYGLQHIIDVSGLRIKGRLCSLFIDNEKGQ